MSDYDCAICEDLGWVLGNNDRREPCCCVSEPEQIIGVAINYPDGLIWMPKPARHGSIIKHCHEHTGRITKGDDPQGFFTDQDRFVDRKEGAALTIAAGQADPAKMARTDMLFSEDLW